MELPEGHASDGTDGRIVEPLGLMPLEVTVEKKEFICPACDHRKPLTEAGDDACNPIIP